MFDFSNLPIPGGVFVAGALWAGVSAFGLGPLVANRTIENSGWSSICEASLDTTQSTPAPSQEAMTTPSCRDLAGAFSPEAVALCDSGGGRLFDMMRSLDPTARLEAERRRREADRQRRIAALAPSRCACAQNLVASERLTWGLYAGSARLMGGPQNLTADLTQALHSPTCALPVEG